MKFLTKDSKLLVIMQQVSRNENKSCVDSSVHKPIRKGKNVSTHADWSRSLLGNNLRRGLIKHTSTVTLQIRFSGNFSVIHGAQRRISLSKMNVLRPFIVVQ